MDKRITIYHGSEKIVEQPSFGDGKKNNDFGLGLYCTVSEELAKDQYYVLRKSRDDEANQLYLEMLEEESDGLYIQDIMRGGIKNDDPRIPRNISE